VFSVVGCSKPVGDLTGHVTYKERLLSFGWVKLLGSDGLFRDAKIEAGGTYRFSGVPVGEAKFTVSCVDPKIQDAVRGLIGKRGDGNDKKPTEQGALKPAEDPFAKYYLVPREYEDVTKTKLTFELQPGPNTFDINLK